MVHRNAQVRGDIIEKPDCLPVKPMEDQGGEGCDVLAVLNNLLLNEGIVTQMGFETAGSDALVKALAGSARQEAKEFPRVRRRKGAARPFEGLRWLATPRLQTARKEKEMLKPGSPEVTEGAGIQKG
jgi:hypothetical protein